MTEKELIQTALNEVRESSERNFVCQIKDRIKKISDKQKSIEVLRGDIATLQKEIRSAELAAIDDDICGAPE